ncbi:kinase-like domain-containing protein [Ganoderma leucocontextum]|nr:kinase-like domain-containing protein [Ganoderma leucocontextum]
MWRAVEQLQATGPSGHALISGMKANEHVADCAASGAMSDPSVRGRHYRDVCMGKVLVPASDTVVERSDPDECAGEMYRACPPEVISKRYIHNCLDRVSAFVGQGSFGAVYEATDLYTDVVVAVKVFHKKQHPHRDIRTEESIYAKLVQGRSSDIQLFAEVFGTGHHMGHRFIVMEMCGPTLDVLLNAEKMVPLPRRHVQEIGYQLIQGVGFLHSLGLIHTDLKPDNIALKCTGYVTYKYFDPTSGFREHRRLVSTQLCILDLGGVVDATDLGNEGDVGAMTYRAPEVSLGMRFGYGVDTFAVGCMLAEVQLNRPLFPYEIADDREHLALVERICGPFPFAFVADFEKQYPGYFHIEDDIAFVAYPGKPFNANVHNDALCRLRCATPISTRIRDGVLSDLLRGLLRHDPSSRLTMQDALHHEFFDDLHHLRL